MIVSAIRWMLLDLLHAATGLKRPNWNFGKLQSNLQAYKMLEENHYRFYQFYGNSLVSVFYSYTVFRFNYGILGVEVLDALLIALVIVLFIASRDSLKKYYERVDQLLN